MHLNPNLWWYIARASGIVAWGLLATSVFWGLVYAGRLTRKMPPPAWNLDLHRFLGGLSLTFVAVHILGLAADRYVNFGLSQIFLPLASAWRPGAVAWGVTAMYLLIAVEATSLAMRWIPRRLWRKVHLLSFVLFVFSTVHSVQSGSDTANVLVRAVGMGLIALAAVTAAFRVVHARRRQAARAEQPTFNGAPAGAASAPSTDKAAGPVREAVGGARVERRASLLGKEPAREAMPGFGHGASLLVDHGPRGPRADQHRGNEQ